MSICFRLSSHFKSSPRKTPASIPGVVAIFLLALLVENGLIRIVPCRTPKDLTAFPPDKVPVKTGQGFGAEV